MDSNSNLIADYIKSVLNAKLEIVPQNISTSLSKNQNPVFSSLLIKESNVNTETVNEFHVISDFDCIEGYTTKLKLEKKKDPKKKVTFEKIPYSKVADKKTTFSAQQSQHSKKIVQQELKEIVQISSYDSDDSDSSVGNSWLMPSTLSKKKVNLKEKFLSRYGQMWIWLRDLVTEMTIRYVNSNDNDLEDIIKSQCGDESLKMRRNIFSGRI
ncbi:hypothetical protein HK096_004520, partial [Nowakowskiella sp. JEL0078]